MESAALPGTGLRTALRMRGGEWQWIPIAFRATVRLIGDFFLKNKLV
jgi:hypothetical protein